MLSFCPSLLSLPHISNWNKNINITKNLLTINFSLSKLDKNMKGNIDLKEDLSIIFIGKTCSGKTTLFLRLIHNEFRDIGFNSTLGPDKEIMWLEINNYKIKLQIWDTARVMSRFPLPKSILRKCDGIIYVLDITDEYSFEVLELDTEFEKKNNYESVAFANKIDLEEKRKVTKETLEELGKKYNIKIFEVSAKTGENFNEAFGQLFELMLKKRGLL